MIEFKRLKEGGVKDFIERRKFRARFFKVEGEILILSKGDTIDVLPIDITNIEINKKEKNTIEALKGMRFSVVVLPKSQVNNVELLAYLTTRVNFGSKDIYFASDEIIEDLLMELALEKLNNVFS